MAQKAERKKYKHKNQMIPIKKKQNGKQKNHSKITFSGKDLAV